MTTDQILTRSVFALTLLLLATGCGDDSSSFVGTYDGTASLTSGTRTVTKAGPVSIAAGAQGAVVVSVQLPLPTLDPVPKTTACAIPAKLNSSGDLQFDTYDCPPVTVFAGCNMILKVATGTGKRVGSTLTLSGSGTVLAPACGEGGSDITDSFSFTAPLTGG